MKRVLFVTVFAALASTAGCFASFKDTVCEYADGKACDGDGAVADGSQADTSTDAGADREPPPGCTTPEEPLKNPEKCLVDSFGAFVSPTGDDGNPGTKAKPFKTIGKALGTTQTRIVVCEGTYGEALDLGRDVDIYGAIACTFDKAGAATKIESGKTTGLTVSRGAVGLFGVSVTAVDATEPGESSVGIVVGSGVTFKMVGGSVTAGTGSSPPDGTTTSNYSPLAQNDPKIKGNDGTGNVGGVTQTCAMLGCVEMGTGVEGGAGGAGSGAGGAPGFDGKSVVSGAPATAGKGGLWDGIACANGRPGAAADGANGGAGAPTPFTIESNKLTATRGTAGQTARAGQGGGGGSGGMSATTGGGGSGGCGGCGGGKGQGGLSGGSSFAVLSVAANVSLDTVTLKASAGGKGGKGGDGQVGQLGGLSGAPAASGIGCPGGLGGQGGQGGGGGGGAGGHSAAVAYTGTKPSMKGVTPEVAQTPAAGGDPGTSAATVTQATAGAPGKTGTELAL